MDMRLWRFEVSGTGVKHLEAKSSLQLLLGGPSILPSARGNAPGSITWDPCHIINEKRKPQVGDMPTMLDFACQRCQHDPDLKLQGSYKQFEETVQWGDCGQTRPKSAIVYFVTQTECADFLQLG